MAKLKTPYADLLPPLSTEEFEALKADLKTNGQRVPVDVDEDGNILDGHHRFKILKAETKTRVVRGLSDDEKLAFAIRANVARRNLSRDQLKELDRKHRNPLVKRLKEGGHRQQEIASLVALSQGRVSQILGGHTISANNMSVFDCRVKVPPQARAKMADRVEDGEPLTQVAADYGIGERQASRIVTKEKKRQADERQQRKNIAQAKKETADDNQHVIHGDFREHADEIEDESVSLIFTDPPYDRKSLDLYGDLAEFGAAKLQSGGSLLCYAGHYLLADILPRMTAHLRLWWVCCCQHTGKSARMTEYGIIVGWKPILWFVKETRGDKDTFVDDIVVSEMEKGTHAWQQGLVEAQYYVENLTRAGDLIVDPFCGGGTTAVAAKLTGRRWRAFEIAEASAIKARKRIRDANI